MWCRPLWLLFQFWYIADIRRYSKKQTWLYLNIYDSWKAASQRCSLTCNLFKNVVQSLSESLTDAYYKIQYLSAFAKLPFAKWSFCPFIVCCSQSFNSNFLFCFQCVNEPWLWLYLALHLIWYLVFVLVYPGLHLMHYSDCKIHISLYV